MPDHDQSPASKESSAASSTPDEIGSARLVGDPTIISKRPPLNTLPTKSLAPRELGVTLIGRSLAHFRLEEFVGGGGMGAVFRAIDTMLDRTVAVKVLSRDQGQDDETVKRFHNEAQSAARLDHENIARVYYVGEDDGWYFIVFEFIEGMNLREYVAERGPMPFAEALQVTQQLAAALEHSAKRDVVHRDIKPSNVLLTPAGRAKLVDMGLARLRPLQADENELTASGVTLGTFDYISPEQARDPRTADVRSDIYSLGCTFYFMLTGQPPFPDGTVLQKLLSHSGETPPDPRRLRLDLPDEIIPVMNRMLAKKPVARYQTPSALLSELVKVGELLGLQLAPRAEEQATDATRSFGSRLAIHVPWVVPTATMLLLATFWNPTWLDGSISASIEPRRLPRPKSVETNKPANESANPSGQLDRNSNGELTGAPSRRKPLPGSTDPSEFEAAESAAGKSSEHAPFGRPSEATRSADPADSTSLDGTALKREETQRSDTGREDSRGDRPGRRVAERNTTPRAERLGPPRNGARPNELRENELRENELRENGLRENGLRENELHENEPRAEDETRSGQRPESARTLIVGRLPGLPQDEGEDVVNDFADACRRALQDPGIDRIEIRQNGRLELAPLTLAMDGRKLTVVAGKGFTPTLTFRTPISVTDSRDDGMIRIRGGRLTMVGLQLEMIVPLDTLDGEWCLFELEDVESVRLEQATVLIRNSQGARFSNLDNVAVFSCVAPDRYGVLATPPNWPQQPTHLQLLNSTIRCEATVLLARRGVPIQFEWSNGLLITSERLARVGGCETLPPSGDEISLKLKNLTAIVDQGLGEFAATAAHPYLIPVTVRSDNCIWVTQRWSSLVSQSGPRSLSEFVGQLSFTGSGNAYEGMESLWRIRPDTKQTTTWDFERWRYYWQLERQLWQQVAWQKPVDKNQTIHEQTTNDYLLDVSASGQQALLGCQHSTLAKFPDADPATPRKTRPYFRF